MSRLALGVLAATVTALSVGAAATQDPQFRVGVNTVSVYATVADGTGRLVPNLSQADFAIFADGQPQKITQFANTVQPITVVVMIDRSVSLQGSFRLEPAGAEAFIADLQPGDRARVGSFNGMIQIDPVGFTEDRDDLIRILHLDLLDPGLTPLWNATRAAMNALERQPGRRVVLLFSDGDNNPGTPDRKTVSYSQVLAQAQADDVMIYAVGLNDGCDGSAPEPRAPVGGARPRWQCAGPPLPGGGPDNGGAAPGRPGPGSGAPSGPPVGPGGQPIVPAGGSAGPGLTIPIDALFGKGGLGERRCANARPRPILRDLAADGGGAYFELQPNDDLTAVFARLAEELHHQYLLGFTITTLDGKTHALEVRVRDSKLSVRARQAYLAASK